MTREEKIKKIKEVIWTTESKRNELVIHAVNQFWMNKAWPIMQGIVSKFDELCWPKTMIGDVLDWIQTNMIGDGDSFRNDYYLDLCGDTFFQKEKNGGLWKQLRKPLEDQSEECIDFIYSLIQDD